jgi:60 kDa SS-A/Ro ribonucleoprotein
MVYAKHVSRRKTEQTAKAKAGQVQNAAGGYTFPVDVWQRVERFAILGAEGGTYYVGECTLTRDNVAAIDEAAKLDPARLCKTLEDISCEGRAPKQAPVIFALQYLSGHEDEDVRRLALDAMTRVCRTASQFFDFIRDIREYRGWGRLLRNAVKHWYLSKEPRDLAYQITKYRQRGGVTHRDLLRLCHPSSDDPHMTEVLTYAAGKLRPRQDLSEADTGVKNIAVVEDAGSGFRNWCTSDHPHRRIIGAVAAAARATTENEVVRLIKNHALVRECVPTQFLNSVKVWDALLEHMPITAMIRNLGKMTAIGLLSPLSEATNYVAAKLTDVDMLRKGRIHPLTIFTAHDVYRTGHGMRGKLTWNPVCQISQALDAGFYKAFSAIEPTGKRWYLAVDISGSMGWNRCTGVSLSCRTGAGLMAMVTVRTEPQHVVMGFSHHMVDLTRQCSNNPQQRHAAATGITPTASLADVEQTLSAHPMGNTDCALPMLDAMKRELPVDVFVIYTDNETWYGDMHPYQALECYRRAMGIPAKLIVVAMTATHNTIADPDDARTMSIVGFDTTAPAVMADFVRRA